MGSSEFPWWLLMLWVGWVPALVLHELGHAAAGRLAGLDVVACGVGTRRVAGVRLLGCRWLVGRGSGGLTVFVPRRWAGGRWRLAVFTAGGPAANLLAAHITAAVGVFGGGAGWWAFAGVNLLVGVTNLYPHYSMVGAGWVPSDGQALWSLRHRQPVLRAVALARQWELLHAAVGEPRGYALHLDQAAAEWALLGASDQAAACRAAADVVRVSGGRFERAVEVLSAGVTARAAGDLQSTLDRLAEVRALAPADAALQSHATALLAEVVPADPWFQCWLMRRAAAGEPDPAVAADLYSEAIRAAYAGAPGMGDHTDDLRAFADATDRLLLDYRRCVADAGGDPRAATRELLQAGYAGWRLVLVLPAPAAIADPIADRKRWGLALRVTGVLSLVGVSLLMLAVACGQPNPVGRVLAVAGIGAMVWAAAVVMVAAAFVLLPSTRPGRGDTGRSLLTLAWGAVAVAVAQAGVAGWWVATH